MKKIILLILGLVLLAGNCFGAKLYIVPGLTPDITDGTYDPGNGETGNAYGNTSTAMTASSGGDSVIFRSGSHTRPTGAIAVNKLLYFSLYSGDSAKALIPGQETVSSVSWEAAGDGSSWGPDLVINGGGNGGNDAAHLINAGTANFEIYPEARDIIGRPVYVVASGTVSFNNPDIRGTTNGVLCVGGTTNWFNPIFYDLCTAEFDAFKVTAGTHTVYHGVVIARNLQASCFYATGGTINAHNTIVYHGQNSTNNITWKQSGTGAVNVYYSAHNNGIWTAHTTNESGTITVSDSFLNTNAGIVNNRPAFLTFFLQDANHAAGGAWAGTSLKRYTDIATANDFILSYYPDDGDTLDASQVTNMNNYIALGNEVGVTGASSSRLDSPAPLQVASTETNPQFVVVTDDEGGCVITLKSDGNEDIVVPNTAKSDTVGKNRYVGTATDGLLKFINDQTNWTAQLAVINNFDDAYNYCLASNTYTITAVMQDINWNETRWLTEEINNSKGYIAEKLNLGLIDLTTYYYAKRVYSANAKPFLQSAGIDGAFYSDTSIVQELSALDLTAIESIKILPSTIRGAGYDVLSASEKEARIKAWANNFAVLGNLYGSWSAIELYNTNLAEYDDTNTLTAEEIGWIVTTIKAGGGGIKPTKEVIAYIKNTGVDGGDDDYTIPFPAFIPKLLSSSLLINEGDFITGVNEEGQADPWGKFVYKIPNIGADQGAGAPTGGSKFLQLGGKGIWIQ